MYKVKEVAILAGVSVRTLHHYDHIGLLKPETVTTAGYRFYTQENLERLQQILFFKELGFSLEEIKDILDNPCFDRKKALNTHKKLLLQKKNRLEKMIATVEKTIQSIEGGRILENQEMFKGFSMKDIKEQQEKYAQEAREKYGKETVEKVEERTASYSQNDWSAIQSKTDAIYHQIIAGMDQGPADEKVQNAVGEWKQLITDHFYDCTIDIFRGLGELYMSDERFTKNINKYHPNLAPFLKDAIDIFCNNHSS